MSDPSEADRTFALQCAPGIRRDGTTFDGSNWQDGQWVRFQRGKPRKIGGFRMLSDVLQGPIRATHVDARGATSTVHCFSKWGVEQLIIDAGGSSVGLAARTPGGFVSLDYAWQTAQMFQSGGSGTPTLIACATPDLDFLPSDTEGPIYRGDITATAALVQVTNGAVPITVSGGICVLQPFLFVYGSNGLIRNSNPNDISDPSGWATGGANFASTANVAGTKIVKGLAMRGGSASPAGLFWALDALIRVTFVGGTTLWNYDTLSDDITVLSKSSIVEFDNAYYWIGVDRFYVYNGVAQELPNQLNFNFFFDNLNFAQRQKVWALKVSKFGEIWWFFPSGASTECDAVIIYNVREQTWYDSRVMRTAGSPAKFFARPLMTQTSQLTTAIPYTPTAGAFVYGDLITGSTSGATGTVLKVTATQLNLTGVIGIFNAAETIHDAGADTGTTTGASFQQMLSILWDHENGFNEVNRQQSLGVASFIETGNFGWNDASPTLNVSDTYSIQTRLTKIEPDFVLSGDMTVTVRGKSYAQGPVVDSNPYVFDGSTEHIDPREQRREMSLRFDCSDADSAFQFGKVLLTIEPGDESG